MELTENDRGLIQWGLGTIAGQAHGESGAKRIAELRAYFDRSPEVPQIIVKVRGGFVQGCVASGPAQVIVLDYDVESMDADDTRWFPEADGALVGGRDERASWFYESPLVDSDYARRLASICEGNDGEPITVRRDGKLRL